MQKGLCKFLTAETEKKTKKIKKKLFLNKLFSWMFLTTPCNKSTHINTKPTVTKQNDHQECVC